MKIILVRDKDITIDLARVATILNKFCRSVKFDFYAKPVIPDVACEHEDVMGSTVNFDQEINMLMHELLHVQKGYTIYVTARRYPDNYFYHATQTFMILSFYGWQHYTSLPKENGLVFFIARTLLLKIDDDFRHEQSTGCVYDFLSNKTDVHAAMKMGFICEGCLERVKKKTIHNSFLVNLLLDVIIILKVLSNASRSGKSVFALSRNEEKARLDWSTFEDEVGQLYRQLGAKVKQDVSVGGFQIDIYVEEQTPSEQKARLAIECKFYDKKVGIGPVRDFAKTIEILKATKKIDKGIIVSYSGFSREAWAVSESTGIELLDYKDLKQKAVNQVLYTAETVKTPKEIMEQKLIQIERKKERSPRIFVIMPFVPELDDLYYLGIHEVAKRLHCSCERVDTLEFIGSVMDRINDSISNARVIVAEVTSPNLNVYYETGLAHGLKKPTVLVTKDISKVPFDLKGYNHIVYKDIRDLKAKLKPRLKAILNQ